MPIGFEEAAVRPRLKITFYYLHTNPTPEKIVRAEPPRLLAFSNLSISITATKRQVFPEISNFYQIRATFFFIFLFFYIFLYLFCQIFFVENRFFLVIKIRDFKDFGRGHTMLQEPREQSFSGG